jgi:hypothetical protein
VATKALRIWALRLPLMLLWPQSAQECRLEEQSKMAHVLDLLEITIAVSAGVNLAVPLRRMAMATWGRCAIELKRVATVIKTVTTIELNIVQHGVEIRQGSVALGSGIYIGFDHGVFIKRVGLSNALDAALEL